MPCISWVCVWGNNNNGNNMEISRKDERKRGNLCCKNVRTFWLLKLGSCLMDMVDNKVWRRKKRERRKNGRREGTRPHWLSRKIAFFSRISLSHILLVFDIFPFVNGHKTRVLPPWALLCYLKVCSCRLPSFFRHTSTFVFLIFHRAHLLASCTTCPCPYPLVWLGKPGKGARWVKEII